MGRRSKAQIASVGVQEPDTKYCSGCKRSLPIVEFGILASSMDGRRYQCRQCESEYALKVRQESRHIKIIELFQLLPIEMQARALSDALKLHQKEKAKANGMATNMLPAPS